MPFTPPLSVPKQLDVKIIKAVDLPLVSDNTDGAHHHHEHQPTAFVRITIPSSSSPSSSCSSFLAGRREASDDQQQHHTATTSVSDGKSVSPFWKESFVFGFDDGSEISSSTASKKNNIIRIRFDVFNRDLFSGDQLLCSGELPFNPTLASSSTSNVASVGGEEQVVSLSKNDAKLFVRILVVDDELLKQAYQVLDEINASSGRRSNRGGEAQQQKQEQEQKSTTEGRGGGLTQMKYLSEFPEDKRGSLVKCFNIFDVDGNGTLSPSESLAAFLTFFPSMSATRLRKKIQEADTNQDGNLDINEFARIAVNFI